jgi:hypothetical protein
MKSTTNMVASRHGYARQNHNLRIDDKTFENMTKFRYMETTGTNQNCIQEKIKSR